MSWPALHEYKVILSKVYRAEKLKNLNICTIVSGSLYCQEGVHIDRVMSSNDKMIQGSNCDIAAHVKRVVNGDKNSGLFSLVVIL